MKEYLVLIRNQGNPVANLTNEEQRAHIEKVGRFIQEKISEGQMLSAEPLERQGIMLAKSKKGFIDGPFSETKEVISGYYLMKASGLDAVKEILQQDPRFEEGNWRMEIRPIMKVNGINR